MERRIGYSILAAVLLCFAYLPVRAELITIAISGQVTGVSDEHGHFGGQIHVGDTITGTYTYDSATLDSYPEDLTYAKYLNYSAPTGISLYVDGFNFGTNPNNVEVGITIRNDDFGEDRYTFGSNHNLSLPDGTSVQHLFWELDDPTGTALSSDALPLTAPDLSRWSSNVLSISTDRDFSINAVVTSAIPEPATLFLTVLGLIVVRKYNHLNK
jgi:hypothetical protein